MEIIVVMVKELCEKSGVGMMDCKKVFVEIVGDMEVVIDWLCVKGIVKVDKKLGCMVVEGFIGIVFVGYKVVVVEVNFEIDFVVCNDVFQDFVCGIVQVVFFIDGIVEVVGEVVYLVIGKFVIDLIKDVVVMIGENMVFCCLVVFFVEYGVVVFYIYNVVGDGIGKFGVFVVLKLVGDKVVLILIGCQVVMYIVVMNLFVICVEEVDQVVVDCECVIFIEQVCVFGKLDLIIEKMVDGCMCKFFEEVVFFLQVFVVNFDLIVGVVVKEVEKEVGVVIEVVGMVCLLFGEGIEKEVFDFVVEVVVVVKG